jgi:hypothetical protein
MAIELENAEMARQQGFEGRARVCSRRAAAIGVRVFLRLMDQRPMVTSAYEVIQQFKDLEGLPGDLVTIAEHLTLHVDGAYNLPPDIDLIAETRHLIAKLEMMNSNTGSE